MASTVSATSTPRALKARYRRIMRFATKALIQSWFFELALPQIGLTKFAGRGRIKRVKKLAREFHSLAADLGGLMIKLGQFLSSRLDVLPEEITKELEGLQDEVNPEPIAAIRTQLETELGLPLEDAFVSFELEPIAAASLGQAHRAKLSESLAREAGFEDVVVKVLRPGIEKIVEVDIRALRRVGKILTRVRLVARRADVPKLVAEFAQTCYEEIDYLNEARNLIRFSENFTNDPRVGTPLIVWERTSRRVLTLSDVSAIKITDVQALQLAGLDPNAVAAELARITFEQFFVTGFFHADPHPGNIFVTTKGLQPGVLFQLTFIDFGMMGQITDQVRIDLQTLLFALAARDPRGVLLATQKLNFLLPDADTLAIEQALETLFERFGGLGVAELLQTDPTEIRDLAFEYGQLIRTLPFQLPENFLLLFRSLSVISGVTSSLNKDFNLWGAVDPFARSLLNGTGGKFLGNLSNQASAFVSTVLRLPGRIDALIQKVERGELAVRNVEAEKQLRTIDSSVRRVTSAVIFLAMLGVGTYLRERQDQLGNVILILSALPLIRALGIFRRK